MPKIIHAEVYYLVRPHIVLTTSYGTPKQEKAHVLLRLEDEAGNIGFGEATPLPKFTGETSHVTEQVLREVLLPVILGLEGDAIAMAHQLMDRAIAGNYAAKSAVDCAMYDLTAKRLGVPLYVLLGGKVREFVPLNRHISIVDTDTAVKQAQEYTTQGCRSLKMKVGGSVEADIERIRAVRAAVGMDVKIRIDANGGYSYPEAFTLIQKVKDCHLEFYEQLLPANRTEELQALRVATGVPMLIDEGIHSVRDAIHCFSTGTADAVTIKLCKCGGLYPALGIAGIASSMGAKVVVASTYDTQIGCGLCLHLASALANADTGCDLTTYATQPEWARTSHWVQDMKLYVGDAPGCGVFSMKDFLPLEKSLKKCPASKSNVIL